MDTLVRVAFATSDMKQVDQHFGATQAFAVYALDRERIMLREAVQFSASVAGGYEDDGRGGSQATDGKRGSPPGGSGHDQDRLAARIDALDGCAAVYCLAVGASAINQLRVKGVAAVKVPPGAEIKKLLGALQSDLRTGARTWPGAAVARQQPADARRFEEMEAEGWVE